MRNFHPVVLLVTFLLCSPIAIHATEALPKVNGKALDAELYENLIKLSVQQGLKDDAALRNLVKDQLILQEVLIQKASDLKLDKDQFFKTKVEQARKSLMIEAMMDDYMKKHPVTEDELKKQYQEEALSFKDQQQYNLRVIVLSDKANADEVQKKVNQGEDFSELAKNYSLDTSKANGGELGWVLPGQVITPVANVMTNLNKGANSIEPIPTQVGWHIIKLEGKRAFQMPKYEEQKKLLENFLRQKRKSEYVKSLRDAAEVK